MWGVVGAAKKQAEEGHGRAIEKLMDNGYTRGCKWNAIRSFICKYKESCDSTTDYIPTKKIFSFFS